MKMDGNTMKMEGWTKSGRVGIIVSQRETNLNETKSCRSAFCNKTQNSISLYLLKAFCSIFMNRTPTFNKDV